MQNLPRYILDTIDYQRTNITISQIRIIQGKRYQKGNCKACAYNRPHDQNFFSSHRVNEYCYAISCSPLSLSTSFKIFTSYISDRSGLVFPRNPMSNASLADLNSDSFIGSYVNSILEIPSLNSSSGIVCPVSLLSSALNV